MFEQAAELPLSEIKNYRKFAFTEALSDPNHDPFFSAEDAPSWMTPLGYQLYALQDDSATSNTRWNAEDTSTSELRAYRSYMLSEEIPHSPVF
ncbi:hypothetical protein B0H13DRAFT_2301368 [Mycena leptocephala]|nr:hypothetical protein B0H13DRAFT_2301368 [Mycena leptocephala]